MRSMNVWMLAGVVMIGAVACGSDESANRGQASGGTPPGGGAPVATTGTPAAAGSFVNDQLALGRKQQGLAELAAARATRPEVKALAQSIVQDHEATYADLRQLAERQSANVPDPEQLRTERERLAQLSGAEFDREYLTEMIADHQRAVTALEEAGRSADAQVRNWASTAMPRLRRHLAEAQRLQGGNAR